MTNNVRIGVGFAAGVVAFTVVGRPTPRATPDGKGRVPLEQEFFTPQEARDLARTILEAAELANLRQEQASTVRQPERLAQDRQTDGNVTVRVGARGPGLEGDIGPVTTAQDAILKAIGSLRVAQDPDEIDRIDAAAAARGGKRSADDPTRWTFEDGSYIVTLAPEAPAVRERP